MADLEADLEQLRAEYGDDVSLSRPPSLRGSRGRMADAFARPSSAQTLLGAPGVSGTSRDRPSTAASTTSTSAAVLTPLHRAARSGALERLVLLLSAPNVNIDDLDVYGRTPLMYAVHYDHLECAHAILSAGANPDITEASCGCTALHEAAYHGSTLMVLLLLRCGARATLRDHDGRLPLHWATDNANAEVLKLILNSVPGQTVDQTDSAGMTPLMWAAYHNKPKNIKLLLSHHAEVDEKDIDGKTPVHWAIHKDAAALRMLLTLDRTYFRDARGRTVAHTAAEKGCINALGMIVELRADCVNDVDKNMRTPLHWASAEGHADCLALLLSHGANPNVRDRRSATALDYVKAKQLTWQLPEPEEQKLQACAQLLIDVSSTTTAFTPTPAVAARTISPSIPPVRMQSPNVVTLAAQPSLVTASSPQVTRVGSSGTSMTPTALLPQTRNNITVRDIAAAGTWLLKYGSDGAGVGRKKYFRINTSDGTLAWANSPSELATKCVTTKVKGVQGGASDKLRARSDYDESNDKFRYAFSVQTDIKPLELVALSSSEYQAWIAALETMVAGGDPRQRAMSPTAWAASDPARITVVAAPHTAPTRPTPALFPTPTPLAMSVIPNILSSSTSTSTSTPSTSTPTPALSSTNGGDAIKRITLVRPTPPHTLPPIALKTPLLPSGAPAPSEFKEEVATESSEQAPMPNFI